MLAAMRAAFGIALLVACGSAEVDRSARGLTDAERDPGHPGIGRYLFRQDGRSASCTATLVGARTVLTAAHCVGYPEGELELGEPPRRYAVTRDLAHPDWSDGRAWAHDLGLVFLEATPPVPPVPVDLRAPVSGEGVTLVGFGETALNAGDNGERRRAVNQVSEVEELYLVIEGTGGGEGNACRGDSGGPVLSQDGPEAILGVLSYVPNLGQGCGQATWAVRLDRYASWLTTEAGDDLTLVNRGEPELRILSPRPGENVTSPVSIEVYARADRGLAALEIWLDGVVEAQSSTLSYVARRPLAPGPHQLEARVQAPAGRSVQASVAFVVGDPAAAEEEAGGCRHTRTRGAVDWGWWGALLLVLGNEFVRRSRDVACRPAHYCLARRRAQVDLRDPPPQRRLCLWRGPRG